MAASLGTDVWLHFQTNLAGIPITLDQIIRRYQLKNDSFSLAELSKLVITHQPLPPASRLDLVEITTDSGYSSRLGSSSASDTGHTFELRGFDERARTVDITLALHLSRTVEFLVRPIVAPPSKKGSR